MKRLLLVLLCWLVSAPTWAAVGDPPIQQTVCNVASSAAPTCTYGVAVTPGNTLVALVAVRVSQTDTGISDSVNGAWTCPAGANFSDGAEKSLICYKTNTGAGTPVVTLSLGAASVTYWNISEWSGVMVASPEDGASEGSDTTSPYAAGAGFTTTTAGLIVCASATNAVPGTPSPATGFTALTNNGVRDYFQYRVGGTTTSTCDYTATTVTGSANTMLALKEAASASVNSFPRRLQVNP